LIIKFSHITFDAAICLNGELPKADFLANLKIPIISADGATNNLYELGIYPDYIVGDMDSIKSEVISQLFSKSQIFHYSDQNSTDFEKSMIFAGLKGFKRLLVLGANGGHFEHSLNNWSVIARYAHKLELTIYEDGRYGFVVKSDIEFSCQEKETISLIAQPKAVVSSENLNWELKYYDLELGKKEGSRNFATKNIVKLTIHEGEILLFINSRFPSAPVFEKIS